MVPVEDLRRTSVNGPTADFHFLDAKYLPHPALGVLGPETKTAPGRLDVAKSTTCLTSNRGVKGISDFQQQSASRWTLNLSFNPSPTSHLTIHGHTPPKCRP